MESLPQVVVVDAGCTFDVRVIARLRAADPDTRIVVRGTRDTETALGCIEAGCDALVDRDADDFSVRAAMAEVRAGRAVCPPGIAHAVFVRLADLARAERRRAAADSLSLSLRQVAILRLVAEGLSNHQIAERLFVSTGTIKNHLHLALRKLNLPNREQAARCAADRGWFEICGGHAH